MVQKTTVEDKECRLKQGNMYMLEDIALELVYALKEEGTTTASH